MKNRSTLFLLVSIVVLGLFIFLQESWRARVPSKEMKQIRLFDLDVQTLSSVEFKFTNGVVRVVKQNGEWFSGSPGKGLGRADLEMIMRMVSGLNSMGKGTVITADHMKIRGLDPSEYGLDQPRVEISAVDNQGERKWLVGRSTPLGDQVYVKSADSDDVYTVFRKLLQIVPTDPALLRDRLLFSAEPAGVRRIEIRGANGFVQLIKDADAAWKIHQPFSGKADGKEVALFIEKLYQLRIEDFVEDNVTDFTGFGLQGETHQISVGGVDGTARMIVLGDDIPNKEGFIYARRADDNSVFSVKSELRDLMNTKPDKFRDARVLEIALADVTSIQIEREAEKLAMVLDREARAWKVTMPVAWQADPKAVTDLAILWDNAVITAHDVSTNTTPAEWIISFGSDLTGKTNTLEILPVNGKRDGLLVRRDGSPNVFQINLPAVPAGIIDPLVYKDKRVWEVAPDTVQKLTLLKAPNGAQTIRRIEDGKFAADGTNSNLQVDLKAAKKLLGSLSTVSTTGYITYNPRDLETYGLAAPMLELHLGFEGTNELGRVLLVGKETEAGYYSMVKGRDVVFYLPKPFVQDLSVDLLIPPKENASAPE